MVSFNKNATFLLAALALSGCSSVEVKQLYYKDGSLVNTTSCSDYSWLECYKTAGEKCQQSGYEIIEKVNGANYGFLGNQNVKELVFTCKTSDGKEVK